MNKTETNLNNYFTMSLKSLDLLDTRTAIHLVNLSIEESTHKNFYMFQKIKILFVSESFSQCAYYIKQNLSYFYEHCSLLIFSQILYYYQRSSKSSTSSLVHLLNKKDIPFVLAYNYMSILNQKNIGFFKKATKAMDTADYTRCISYCDVMLKQNDQLESANFLKGKSYLMLKQYTKAIFYLQHASQSDPSNTIHIKLLAEAFYKWKKYDSALISFQKVISQNPLYTEAYFRIADIYYLTNHSRKSKRYYKKALRIQAKQNLNKKKQKNIRL